MQLEGIDHVAMGVRDIERSAKWYIDVLGFERLHDGMWDGVPTFIFDSSLVLTGAQPPDYLATAIARAAGQRTQAAV